MKTLISLILLGGLIVWVDWRDALYAVRGMSHEITVLGFVLFMLSQVLVAARLQILLTSQEIDIGYPRSLRLTFAGLLAGNFLPSTVGGDAIKILALRRWNHDGPISVASVIADRLIGLTAIVFLLPILLFVPTLLTPKIAGTIKFVLTPLGIGVIIAGVVYSLRKPTLRHLRSITVASFLLSRISRLIRSISNLAATWITRPRLLLVAVCISWASVLSAWVAVWIVAQETGINIRFIELVAVQILIYFVTLLPITFNGLGIREIGLVYLLSKFDASPEQALALAAVSKLLFLSTSSLGLFDAVMWMRSK